MKNYFLTTKDLGEKTIAVITLLGCGWTLLQPDLATEIIYIASVTLTVYIVCFAFAFVKFLKNK